MFVILKLCDLVCPSSTLPKSKVAGERLNPGWAPEPLRAIVSGEPVASLVTVTLPVTFPVVVGPNVTARIAACDGLIVAGVLRPLTLNPGPVDAILEI